MRYLDRWFGAEGGTRTPTSYLTRPSNVRVCQFRHFGPGCQITIVTQTVNLQFVTKCRAGCQPVPVLRFQGANRLAACSTRLVFVAYFGELAGDDACDAAGEAAGAVDGTGDAAGTGVGSGAVDCKTEREPVIPGNESVSAISIKAAAAPMVTFDKILAVPRGPNAVLETLLEKRSPAPDLPG